MLFHLSASDSIPGLSLLLFQKLNEIKRAPEIRAKKKKKTTCKKKMLKALQQQLLRQFLQRGNVNTADKKEQAAALEMIRKKEKLLSTPARMSHCIKHPELFCFYVSCK